MFRGKKGCSAEKTIRIAFSRSDICGKKCLLAEKQVLLPPPVRTSHKKNDGGKGGGPGTDFREKAVTRRLRRKKLPFKVADPWIRFARGKRSSLKK
ncbi:MAG: hypothetical protein C6W56_13815 [Caldibacillus debilis]|nr:MAG: hypothetical protein C6W56_13815 [Caldibacillus debilis]